MLRSSRINTGQRQTARRRHDRSAHRPLAIESARLLLVLRFRVVVRVARHRIRCPHAARLVVALALARQKRAELPTCVWRDAA